MPSFWVGHVASVEAACLDSFARFRIIRQRKIWHALMKGRPIEQRRFGKPDDVPVSQDQGGARRRSSLLPHGRFLRDVLRRRRRGIRSAGHCFDETRADERREHTDVRSSRTFRIGLLEPIDQEGVQGSGLRTDRRSRRGEEARPDCGRRPRSRSDHHARNSDRRDAAGCSSSQLFGGGFHRAGRFCIGLGGYFLGRSERDSLSDGETRTADRSNSADRTARIGVQSRPARKDAAGDRGVLDPFGTGEFRQLCR